MKRTCVAVPFACWSYFPAVLEISLLFCPESFTLQGNAALFIDGFALVAAIGKLQKAKIFGGFAGCDVNTVLRKGFESMCYATVIGGTPSRQK